MTIISPTPIAASQNWVISLGAPAQGGHKGQKPCAPGQGWGTVTAGEPSLPLSAGYIPTLRTRQRTLRDASGPAVTNPRIRA